MNYAHGYPRFCVSIGVGAGRGSIGVVYDPLLDELFAASAEPAPPATTARCASRATQLRRALLATGFAYSTPEQEDNVDNFAELFVERRAVRRDGSPPHSTSAMSPRKVSTASGSSS